MTLFYIGFYIFFAFIVVIIFLSVKIVPQGSKFLVQRLGKFNRILKPGLNFIIPLIESSSYKISTKDIVLDIPSQEVITRDNVVILANAVAYINLVSPEKVIYAVDNYEVAIKNLVQTTLRSVIGEMNLDDALSSREHIKATLKLAIYDDIFDWGVLMKTVEIQDISPSKTMQKAMEEQAAAERQRRAIVTKAEGEKEAAILEADGRLEASKRDAKAKVVLAEASQQAIEKITSVISDKELPVMYLIGEKYIETLKSFSNSNNTKILLLPAEIGSSIRGILDNKSQN